MFDVEVHIAGALVPKPYVFDVSVDAQLDRPDMATIVLANEAVRHSESIPPGETVEVRLGHGDGAPVEVFRGEVVGLEPEWDAGRPRRVTVRAFNRLHPLGRARRSAAFVHVTDRDIVDQIARAYGLSVDYGGAPPTLAYEHVYQHNQTDLEFLRLRAARLGRELFVRGDTLFFRPRTTADSGVMLRMGVPGELVMFRPLLSTVQQVSEVRVRAYDPEQKREVVGVAGASGASLGTEAGSDVAGRKHPGTRVFECDVPVATREAAESLARAILAARQLSFVTGRGSCQGNPALAPGMVVGLDANDGRFDGKYYLTGVHHRYRHQAGSGAYATDFTFCRDAVARPASASARQEAAAQQAAEERRAASRSAAAPRTSEPDWIEVRMLGEDGTPLGGARFRLELPDGDVREGTLDEAGRVRLDAVARGSCKLTFPDLDRDAWVPA